ncbi:hypothetical protein S40293_11417 [Stachybotrys chartarum IBT 40293]|nr:hypothetical protein S40293_11417 [Stachybotrys chartarum IBT 40293]
MQLDRSPSHCRAICNPLREVGAGVAVKAARRVCVGREVNGWLADSKDSQDSLAWAGCRPLWSSRDLGAWSPVMWCPAKPAMCLHPDPCIGGETTVDVPVKVLFEQPTLTSLHTPSLPLDEDTYIYSPRHLEPASHNS